MKLSVTLATHNEEAFLEDCLKAIKDLADEIIICDGASTDRTVAIAKKYKSKVISTTNKTNFHINKKMANDAAKGDWILQLDADEIVGEKLKNEIREKIKSSLKFNGYWIPRANYFLGKFLKKGGVYPDYTLRLYRNGKGNLPAISVHEQAVVEGEVGYLKNDLLHYSNRSFSDYISKRLNRYTSIMSDEITGGFIENVIIKPLFDSRQGFLVIYLRHLGFMDGFPGFVWALFSALHYPIAYFKKSEKENANHSSD